MHEDKLKVLEAMARNEEKISELYELYAEKFNDMYQFWFLLSNEETNHALWIRSLINPVLAETLLFEENRFRMEGVKLFADYLDQKIAEAKQTDMGAQTALSIALDIENALIEKKWFESIQTDSADAKLHLNRLKDALTRHKNKVMEAMGRNESLFL